MTARRSVAAAAWLGAAMLAAASGAAAQTDADAPQHQLTVFSHGVNAKAGLFTYCRSVTPAQGVPTGVCGDGVPGATATRVPVHRGGAVIITIGAAVTSLVARYAAAGGTAPGPALPVDASTRPAGASRSICPTRGRRICCSCRSPTATCRAPTVGASPAMRTSASASPSIATRARRHAR